MKKRPEPKTQIGVWICPAAKETLTKMAQRENRSLSNFLNAKLEAIVKGAA